VLSNEVIEHVQDCAQHLGEIYRCLKKGGFLLVVTPNKRSALAMLMGRKWYYYQDPTHCLLFDKATLRSSLEKAGFKIIKIKTYFHLSGFVHRHRFLRCLKIFGRLDFPFIKVGDELVVIGQKKC